MTIRLPVIAVLLLARLAVAQVPDTTRHAATSSVGGVVHDSIAGVPLANATVQLVARDDPAFVRTAVSDSLGGYLITDVPVGHYTLGFLHPLLDSLGVDAPLRAIDVANFRPVRIDLAVPSPVRLRRAICGTQQAGDSGAVIIGVVRNAGSETAASQVAVTGEWLEFTLARTGFARSIGRRTATTSDNGWFALCNVPAGGNVALLASKGADSTGLIEVQVPSDGFLRRDLYLGEGELVSSVTEASSDSAKPPQRIHVGNVRLSGTVLSALADRPVANALVFITDGPQARTNDRGEWTISNAPGGTRTLEVRALGFYPSRSNVNVVPSAPPIRVTLSTLKAVLDTVKIIASRLPGGADGGGFARRQRMGIGHFVSAADMRRFPVIVTSDVFRRVPGVRRDFPSSRILLRGAFEPWCEAAIFVDGHYMPSFSAEDIDDFVPPDRVAGIEVYTESNAPPQFQVGLSGCGSIVIWTR
jgi:hypothetical protein